MRRVTRSVRMINLTVHISSTVPRHEAYTYSNTTLRESSYSEVRMTSLSRLSSKV
ncbi:hypothetical protein FA13DRAFT_1736562 [Coprinellus micaceus]|uniref:Uncharacterized protein n=1 Tax=Coprinellus micaceus TaxID=71717 RepID=A0A4Y7T0J1_COPMI|nr:hypothetical protein FA13DRAFT_1736562 [Coprinellus micaceus]